MYKRPNHFKRTIAVIAAFTCFVTAGAQTIANPGFEASSACPTTYSQFKNNVSDWVVSLPASAGTPDYFKTCGFIVSGTGYNGSAGIAPYSGTAYAGCYVEMNNSPAYTDYKEYFSCHLTAPLVAGVTYTFSFYTAHLSGGSPTGFTPQGITYGDLPGGERGYLGAVFSTVAPVPANTGNGSGNNPRYNSIRDDFGAGRVLIPATDTSVYGTPSRNTWVKVTLHYTAVGGEEYMTLGQFRPGGTSLPAANAVYYLFDQFSASLAVAATLTKSVSPASIISGGTATYTFTLNNTAPGNTGQSDLSFTDSLPAGLRIAAIPNVTVSAGLTGGSITAVPGGTFISVSGYNQTAGSIATITVDVTNNAGETNASCGSNPPAFTNTAANISALSDNIINGVGNVCLIVNKALPVTLQDFRAARANHTAVLTWTTAHEKNTSYFVVERSVDGLKWLETGKQQAAGSSEQSRNYVLIDSQPFSGMSYYRLRMVDNTGDYSISEIRALVFEDNARPVVTAAPNPATPGTQLLFSKPVTGKVRMQLTDAMGRVIRKEMIESGASSYPLDLSHQPAGLYHVRLDGDGLNSSVRLLKQ